MTQVRQVELETLFAAVTSEPGRVVLVGGAGVGKTHLARTVVRTVTERGWTSEWVSATAAMGSVPFGALARFIGAEVRDVTNRTEVLRSIVSRFAAPDATDLLVIDDAHHLDVGSAALVHELAVSGRVRMLLTVRSGEPVSDAVRRLWLDRFAVLVDVEPLDLDATRAFVAGGLGGPVDALSAHRLWHWTGGNALFLHELVQAGHRQGRLVATDGIWSWVGPSSVSANLLDLLDDRLDGLDPAQRETLLLVALAEPVDGSTLRRLASARTVDELRRLDLLMVERIPGGYAYRMPHPLYADAVLATASPDLVQRSRLSLADALTASGTAEPQQVLRRAVLRLDAAQPPEPDELAQAATIALDLFDGALAERCTAALSTTRPDWAALRARALALQGRATEAEALLADADEGALLPVRARNLAFGLHHPDLAVGLLEDALPRCGDAARLGLVDALVATLTFAGRYREAVDVYGQYCGALEDCGRPEIGNGTSSCAASLAQLGDPSAAALMLRRQLGRPATPEVELAVHTTLVNALYSAGRLDEAGRASSRFRTWGVECGHPGALANGCMLSGLVALHRGRYLEAAQLLREGVSLARSNDPYGMIRFGLAWLAAAEAMGGDTATAIGVDAEARALLVSLPAKRLLVEAEETAHAFVLACAGRTSQARDALLTLAERCVAEGVLTHVASAATLLARLGDVTTATRLMERTTGHADTPLLRVQQEHVGALRAHQPDELLGVAERYAELGACHVAAEVLDVAAAAHASAVRVRAAGAVAARRDELLRECDTGPLPWWPSHQRHELTRREREIAKLAADGLSNRAIADDLVLSVRTVENHLRSVYVKLGITRRRELATALTVTVPRE